MRRSRTAPRPLWAGLACAAALLQACSLSHGRESASSTGLSAGAAGSPADALDAGATSRPEPTGAGSGAGTGAPSTPSGTGDVSATPGATASPDAGAATACSAAPTPGEAPPVTTLEAVLRKTEDASLNALVSAGEAVALDGDTLAIGAPRNATQAEHGSVLVFVRAGEAWVKQAELLPPAGAPDSWFGQSIALSGDTLAVAAPEEFFDPPAAGNGSVHVFTRAAGAWQLDDTLTAELPADGDHFGDAIALDGDTLAVTAHTEQIGRIELFERGESGFEHSQVLHPEAPEAQVESIFVGPLALDGDILAASVMPAIGDPGQRVHVFERSGGRFETTARVAGDRPGEAFGIALALQGHTLVVGDSYLGTAAGGGLTPTGGAYVFERDCDGSWTQRALLTDPSEALGGDFGRSLAIDGARILVGNPADPSAARGIDGTPGAHAFEDDYTGAVHVFGVAGDGYAPMHFLKPGEDAPRETYFGMQLAASGGRIAIGARGEDAAYVFR